MAKGLTGMVGTGDEFAGLLRVWSGIPPPIAELLCLEAGEEFMDDDSTSPDETPSKLVLATVFRPAALSTFGVFSAFLGLEGLLTIAFNGV
jgi:hypothetical protein